MFQNPPQIGRPTTTFPSPGGRGLRGGGNPHLYPPPSPLKDSGIFDKGEELRGRRTGDKGEFSTPPIRKTAMEHNP